jgi:hypothetical protein
MRETAALLLILILSLSIASFIIPLNSAITTPTIPNFTLKYVDNSYDVQPTYGVDQYTGETVVTQAGYHVQNRSIVVSISNQAFSSYYDSEGHRITLSYDIRWKGHFGDIWTEITSSLGGYVVASSSLAETSGGKTSLVDPDAPFTVVTFSLSGNNGTDYGVYLNIESGGQIDFQVEALIGYNTAVQVTPSAGDYRGGEYYVFTGESSGWSNTQTITINEGASTTVSPSSSAMPSGSASQNPTSTTSQPNSGGSTTFGLDLLGTTIVVLLASIVVLLVFVVFYLRKRGVNGSVKGQTVREGSVVSKILVLTASNRFI